VELLLAFPASDKKLGEGITISSPLIPGGEYPPAHHRKLVLTIKLKK